MAKLSTDLRVSVLHPRETLFISGLLGALNANIVVVADAAASVALDLRGTFSLTVVVEGTVDGINWVTIPMRPQNVASVQYVAAIVGTAQGVWLGSCAGYSKVRANVSAYTSGSAVATLCADNAPIDQSRDGNITPLLVTATGAAAAAVTLTLPAPGAGLRQYITYLSINRFATALLTAASAPVIVTTTNLPGSLAFTMPADALPLGSMGIWREDFAYALAASAQNTAVTIVCPATTAVIWRVTAGYYVAP